MAFEFRHTGDTGVIITMPTAEVVFNVEAAKDGRLAFYGMGDKRKHKHSDRVGKGKINAGHMPQINMVVKRMNNIGQSDKAK